MYCQYLPEYSEHKLRDLDLQESTSIQDRVLEYAAIVFDNVHPCTSASLVNLVSVGGLFLFLLLEPVVLGWGGTGLA